MKKDNEINIYLFGGLGADKRAFKYLTFPENSKVIHVEWTDHKNCKGIDDYAQIIQEQIKTENNIYIGVSFGAMLAQEVHKIKQADKLIIISSVTKRSSIPVFYRFLGRLGIQHILPASFLQKNPITFKLFGIKTERDKKLLQRILDDTDLKFLKWAIIACLRWRPKKSIYLYHIHGNSDKIIPIKWVKPDYIILGGGHFMIVDKAKEISKIISSIFA